MSIPNDFIRIKTDYRRTEMLKANRKWPEDVRRGLDFLNTHLFDFGFRLQHMWEECRLNQKRFPMKFRYFTGFTPQRYVRSHRVGCSVKLMAHFKNKVTISEVAFEVGYENPSTFSLAFKNMEGVTPRKFKRESIRSGELCG